MSNKTLTENLKQLLTLQFKNGKLSDCISTANLIGRLNIDKSSYNYGVLDTLSILFKYFNDIGDKNGTLPYEINAKLVHFMLDSIELGKNPPIEPVYNSVLDNKK